MKFEEKLNKVLEFYRNRAMCYYQDMQITRATTNPVKSTRIVIEYAIKVSALAHAE